MGDDLASNVSLPRLNRTKTKLDYDSDFDLNFEKEDEEEYPDEEYVEFAVIDCEAAYTTRQKRQRKKMKLPRVLRSDIKRHYSRMFMNTINSADIIDMQNFWNTFMLQSCKFVAQRDNNSLVTFPIQMEAYGPRETSHYLLGVFFMLPDLVISLTDTRIVTSAGRSGSRIEMCLDLTGTQVCALPTHLWVPTVTMRGTVSSAKDTAVTSDTTPVPSSSSQTGGETMRVNKPAVSPQYITASESPYISRVHMRSMCAHACPLATPLSVVATGKITFYLDTDNHIQHLHMFMK